MKNLTFIVNGEPCEIASLGYELLRQTVTAALTRTRNTGRPREDWELRKESGEIILVWDLLVEDYAFKDNERLFLTLRVGAGGST